jgi:2-polyprenyl-3-methyl-5-hydroxy-6-metoxy-1,4-benzoquinol methylase
MLAEQIQALKSQVNVRSAADEVDAQERFWNAWNAGREKRLQAVSEDQSTVILEWLKVQRRTSLDLLEVGCGAGWMSERLRRYGSVTAVDLAREVVARAKERFPGVRFLAGDFMTLSLPKASFDVVVSLEVLSHVADQAAFLDRIADLLRPGGTLMLATQNRRVLERCSWVAPQGKGQIRHWVDRPELARLLRPRFDVREMSTVTPDGDLGTLRIVNSVKLNRLLTTSIPAQNLRRWKERLGCGRTIMVLAVKRGG